MSILRDIDIYNLIQDKKLISSGLSAKEITYEDKNSPIQPSSLDLRVGEIYCPSEVNQGANHEPLPLDEYILSPGQTVFVTTLEELDLPKDIAGIGFPPSRMSVNGILTTNPGHVDPGYKGKMHLTIINMGRNDHVLRTGDLVITLLFFKLNKESHSDWQSRVGEKPTPEEERKKISDILYKLAPHFMNFDSKAKEVAKNITNTMINDERDKLNRARIYIAIVSVIITFVIIWFNASTLNKQSNLDYQQSKLDARLTILEAGPKFEEKLDELKETELLKLEERLEQLEGHLATIEENISKITSRIGQ